MRISILTQLVISIVFLYLLSCKSPNIDLSKNYSQETVKGEEKESLKEREFEKYISALPVVRDEYLYILQIAQHLQFYVNEILPNKFDLRENEKNDIKESPVFGREDVEILNKEATSLVTGEAKINDFLYKLLDFRFKYLKTRELLIKKGVLLKDEIIGIVHPITMYPTNRQFLDWIFKNNNLTKKNNKKIKKQVRMEITRYELLNMLIKETFLQANLNDLDKKTILLLRASVGLHPILAGTRLDLGHPDEACASYYSLITDMISPGNYSTKSYISQVINQTELDLKNDNSNNLDLNYSLSFLHYLYINIRIAVQGNNIKLKQDILNRENNRDINIYNSHPFLSFNEVDVPIAYNHRCKKCIYPLPEPNFLKNYNSTALTTINKEWLTINQKKKKNTKNRHKLKRKPRHNPQPTHLEASKNKIVEVNKHNSSTDTLVEPTSTSPGFLEVELEKITSANQECAAQPSGEKEEILEVILPVRLAPQELGVKAREKEEEKEIEEETPNISEWLHEYKPKQQPKSFPKSAIKQSEPKVSVCWPFEELCPLPRWIRVFHDKTIWSPCLQHKRINNKHQKIVDDLFDPVSQCKITYKEFKAVFTGAGGQIVNTNGSHRALLDLNGIKIPGIDLFVHSKSQTFSKNFIKNLQIAVLYIGLRPSRYTSAKKII